MLFWVLTSFLHAEPQFKEAIEGSKAFPVNAHDALGEGAGCFDSDSRYTPKTVNCQIWLQWTLSTAYANGSDSKFRHYMDALRYYDGVSFGKRKHFVDRWVLYQPEPLVPLTPLSCQTDRSVDRLLNLRQFRQNSGYSLPLFEESESGVERHVIAYMSTARTNECLQSLSDGWYVGFFVASPVWIERWSTIGDFGLVHGMIFEKEGVSITVHHASMDAKRVVSESWEQFHQRLNSVSMGYRLFALTPDWTVDTQQRTRASECP